VSIVTQTAGALADAHARGIVHRDVKPDNILLVDEPDAGEEPFVKLVDFGLALRTEAATRMATLAGTPAYMSPECLTGDPPDAMLDLWGLACTAFYAMTGVEPFADGTAEEVYVRVRYDPLKVPSTVAAGVAPGFDAWFARACARERENRFATAGDLASALRAIRVAAA
jgi:serine/threonine protein kinase